ncbi:1-aminocyclopropane-1-carboxylate deaminase/D-cysteine desulfhydrase [Amycolatopsis sp. YIM 10]|uniref:1-aminocyclopropane-1-carboxylate deaminase/D-cysteine desulfhydrase n=1 Tax=Amycolatopsis sp. YIM 10 TaxID=2653857 RepID=UPI0012900779|nr:pyridoxal-phosphate dependent enzyme [Amycolatopsis sp. YIM 10]QFU90811.1 D-cysteine desulfhydrase [Amycolatopsis sp. YIM 10]
MQVRLPSPVTELGDDRLGGVRVFLKRDDLIHPDFPGNKWRKLKGNIDAAREHGAMLTFGGAYSNHIRAVAAAGARFGLRTIGLIRGEEHLPLNETLAYATGCGMELHYLDRTTYRSRNEPDFLARLPERFGEFHLVPEGGSNALGVRGCTAIVEEIEEPYDVLCCACGTGGTLAGMAYALSAGRRALGFSVLKGGRFLYDDVASLQRAAFGHRTDNWSIELGYHFGGYAKRTNALTDFADDFEVRHGLRLDRVYEAKMLAGLFDLIRQRRFAPGTRIVAVIAG